jgi:sugar phosphate isomerase/epimerase
MMDRVALQFYTLREHSKTIEDFAKSAARVRAIGYRAVQISGVGPMPPSEIRKVCDGEGLTICATHEPAKNICESTQAVVDKLGVLGCKHTAYPYPHVPLDSLDDLKALAEMLTRAGTVLRAAGMTLSYHNHNREFRKVGGKTVLEQIYELTPPDVLQAELDTYWVQAGGGDPVAWIRRMKGRAPLLHLKDYAINAENQPTFAAIGDGNLDFEAIVAAATDSGCEWLIVEQDGGYDDPFAAVQRSFRYLERSIFGVGSSR